MRTEETYHAVETVLMQSEQARNDDKHLIFRVLEHLNVPLDKKNNALIISIDLLDSLPSFESIRRIRQKIQNEEGRFLPTWGNVLVKRGFTEETVRAIFGESSNVFQNYIFIKTEGMRMRMPITVATL